MIPQIIRSAFQSNIRMNSWAATRFVSEKATPQMRQYSQVSSQQSSRKTFTLFGTEYSRRKVYTVAGLILMTDIAIFDYYYFFASKKPAH